ncbi:MAG: hypothetical protein U9Q21_02975 [Candidatus Auribacterota bacterium]|nr:hypothetical protein [Candidatus Auribacterota bacterium]
MVITMKDSKIKSVKDVERFLKKASSFSFIKEDQKEAYKWIEDNLKKFEYLKISKIEKGIIRKYIKKMTGYSIAQITRLIGKYIDNGCIEVTGYKRNCFAKIYSDKEIRLLAKTDELHDYPNGAAVKKNLLRMAEVYGQDEYANIAKISVGHIYNLRKTKVYKLAVITCKKTKSGNGANIGERSKE